MCVVLINMHVLLFGILPDLRGQPQQGVAEGGRRRGWQFDRHQEGESPHLIQSSISPVNANVINDAINEGSRSLERELKRIHGLEIRAHPVGIAINGHATEPWDELLSSRTALVHLRSPQ